MSSSLTYTGDDISSSVAKLVRLWYDGVGPGGVAVSARLKDDILMEL